MNTYGVLNAEGIHTDVSKSEKGAKQYATKHGYTKVTVRYNSGYVIELIAFKNKKGKWLQVADYR